MSVLHRQSPSHANKLRKRDGEGEKREEDERREDHCRAGEDRVRVRMIQDAAACAQERTRRMSGASLVTGPTPSNGPRQQQTVIRDARRAIRRDVVLTEWALHRPPGSR